MYYSVYNITQNVEHKFVSEYIINEDTFVDCDNEFWYIKKWLYNDITNIVVISGQDGMNCSTVTICNFSDPDDVPLKFKNLHRYFSLEIADLEEIVAIGWAQKNDLELAVCAEKNQDINLS